jgi:DNA processing protein
MCAVDRRTAACVFLRERVELELYRFEALVLKFGAPEYIWDANPDELRASGLFTQKQLERLLKRRSEEAQICETLDELSETGLGVVSCFDAQFPAAVLKLPHPPGYLYGQGTPLAAARSVFVTGSGGADVDLIAAGVAVGKQLSKLGVITVSNLAPGVEEAAHVGALSHSGQHLVFLPCGHLFAATWESAAVLANAAASGAVYSEYAPTVEPTEGRRIEACRLAVGAALGVILIGSPDIRTTLAVEAAGAAGKPVFYLDSDEALETALLRQEGAYPIESPDSLERILPYL